MFIDVHTHLDHEFLASDLDQVLQRSQEAQVNIIVSNGVNPASNRQILAMAQKHALVKCALGIYPGESRPLPPAAMSCAGEDVRAEVEFIRQHACQVVAIGEVGLDFVHGESPQQRLDFAQMISLAQSLDKPLIVHSRRAEAACVEMLEQAGARKVIMHCFCGKKKLVQRIVRNGWSLSIPTNVVRSQQFQQMVREVPLEQLFCETDAPYLSPFKNQRNEPAFVVEAYRQIAAIKGLPLPEVAQRIAAHWHSWCS